MSAAHLYNVQDVEQSNDKCSSRVYYEPDATFITARKHQTTAILMQITIIVGHHIERTAET